MRGFTLIELLVVMLVVGTLFSLVGPVGFKQYERTQALKEREQLFHIIEHTRFLAFANRSPLTLHLQGQNVSLTTAAEQATVWQFQYLHFNKQQLTVNANGFWQQSNLQWQEQTQEWQLPLNPEPVQQQPLLAKPIPLRLN